MATFPELVQKLEQCAMPRYSVSAKHIFLEGAWNSWLRHSAVVTRALSVTVSNLGWTKAKLPRKDGTGVKGRGKE